MDFTAFLTTIERYDEIIIFGHVQPDGDCYGSAIGLSEALKLRYPQKKIYAVGSGFDRFLTVLSPMDEPPQEVYPRALGIALDFNTIERSENPRIQDTKEQIMIDHHIPGTVFGTWKWIDQNRVATAEMIALLIRELGWPLSPLGANALFLGIVTDSGRFQYSPLTAETFSLVAFLLDNGADPTMIYHHLYQAEESSLRLKGRLYTLYAKTEHDVIYVQLTTSILKELGISAARGAGVVNLFAGLANIPAWVIMAEDEETQLIHVEVRSAAITIQPVLVAHGGGGHALAAGCRVASWEEATQLLNELDELIAKETKA